METYAVLVIILIVAVILYFTSKHSKRKSYYWCEYNEECEVMTVIDQDGNQTKYHGSSTVWREMPSYKRCSTAKEMWLSDRWSEIRHTKKNTENGLLSPTEKKLN